MAADAKKIVALFDQVKSERTTWESTWQEVADHLLGKRRFSTQILHGGDQRQALIFDGTGMRSADLFSAAISALLTNPATKWFHLVFEDKLLRQDRASMTYLQEVEEQLYFAFNRPGARFQPQIHETYIDLVNFGTGALSVLDDPATGVYFVSRPLNEIFLAEDSRGNVDTVYRYFEMTARQIVQEYPGKSVQAQKLSDAGQPQQKLRVLHALFPNAERVIGNIGPSGMEWASVHVLVGEGAPVVLREGGFHEKPLLTPRWEKDSGEIYGRGPGIQALPDAKLLNQMTKTMLKAGQKAVDPPMLGSDRGQFSNVRTHAGGFTIARFDGSGRPPIVPLESGSKFQIGVELLKMRQDDVESAYHADILEVFRSPHMTATQVIEIANQVQRILAPVLGRQQNELLEPMVERVFAVEYRAGRLPAPPEELGNALFQVVYQSPVARAQQASEKQALFEAMGAVIELSAAHPDALDNFDFDEFVRHTWEISALPARILRGFKEVAAIRDQRARQQAAQAQFAMLNEAAQTASKLPQQPVAQAA